VVYERARQNMEAMVNWLIGNWRRVWSWFQDDVFRRLFANAGKLLGANGIAAVLEFVVAILTARALRPENYGVLALILAYEATIKRSYEMVRPRAGEAQPGCSVEYVWETGNLFLKTREALESNHKVRVNKFDPSVLSEELSD